MTILFLLRSIQPDVSSLVMLLKTSNSQKENVCASIQGLNWGGVEPRHIGLPGLDINA